MAFMGSNIKICHCHGWSKYEIGPPLPERWTRIKMNYRGYKPTDHNDKGVFLSKADFEASIAWVELWTNENPRKIRIWLHISNIFVCLARCQIGLNDFGSKNAGKHSQCANTIGREAMAKWRSRDTRRRERGHFTTPWTSSCFGSSLSRRRAFFAFCLYESSPWAQRATSGESRAAWKPRYCSPRNLRLRTFATIARLMKSRLSCLTLLTSLLYLFVAGC